MPNCEPPTNEDPPNFRFDPPENNVEVDISISGILEKVKDEKKKQSDEAIEKIKEYEELIKNSDQKQDQ